MKITEALCNVITEAGGTPTTADADSVTHALGTLYTTLGGTDTLPDDVADRINSLSDHIGGGGSAEVHTGTMKITNSTGAAVTVDQFVLSTGRYDGKVYATAKPVAFTAGTTKEIVVTKDASDVLTASVEARPWSTRWFCRVDIHNSVDPTKVVATANVGAVSILRNSVMDSSSYNGYVLCVKSNGSTATEQVEVTISVSA